MNKNAVTGKVERVRDGSTIRVGQATTLLSKGKIKVVDGCKTLARQRLFSKSRSLLNVRPYPEAEVAFSGST